MSEPPTTVTVWRCRECGAMSVTKWSHGKSIKAKCPGEWDEYLAVKADEILRIDSEVPYPRGPRPTLKRERDPR